MSDDNKHKLLGQILQEAGLISLAQIQVALGDHEYHQELRIGEVLALRGWIEQKTANFFADDWSDLIKQAEKYPLGYYFERSGLLTIGDIHAILKEQKQLWIKFGSVAVIKGLIEQQTLEFFLANLFPVASLESAFIGARYKQKSNILVKQKAETNNQFSTSKVDDDDDIPWVD